MMNCFLTTEVASYSPGRTYILICSQAVRKTVQIHTALNKNYAHAFKSLNLSFKSVIQYRILFVFAITGWYRCGRLGLRRNVQ